MKALQYLLTIVLISSALFAGKEIGKVMTLEEGEELFGTVTESVSIERETLVAYLSECDSKIMFGIRNGELIVADENRKVLSSHSIEVASNSSIVPDAYYLSDEEVMNVYSKSVVEKLLQKANEKEVTFEMRGDVMTVTHGNYLMEFSNPCPPWCG